MGNVRWELVALVLLVSGLFWLRMELSMSVESLSYDSYFLVRNVEHILETGVPIGADGLSVTADVRVGSPLFSYIMAGLVFLSPLAYKVVPNLVMALLLLPVYFITFRITKSEAAALIAALLAVTGPFVFSRYLNVPSASPLAVLVFLSVLAMLHDPDEYLYWIVGLTVLLTFLHPLIFVLVAGILCTVLLLRLEGFGVDRRLNELFFFTLILALWFHVLVYKRVLFSEGISVIWQNLPQAYIQSTFGSITFLTVLYGLGTLTFLFGVLGAYHALFEQRVKGAFPIIGSSIAVILALLLRMIELELGLMLLTVLLAIMAGYGLLISAQYLRRTRAPWIIWPLGAIAAALFISTAMLPALVNADERLQHAPPAEDIAAYVALRNRLPPDAVVLTTVREAYAVQYFAQRTTLADSDFLLVENGDELVRDVDEIYTARFTAPVMGRAEKYGFTHILFSGDAARRYGRDRLLIGETPCFIPDDLGNAVLYTRTCGGLR